MLGIKRERETKVKDRKPEGQSRGEGQLHEITSVPSLYQSWAGCGIWVHISYFQSAQLGFYFSLWCHGFIRCGHYPELQSGIILGVWVQPCFSWTANVLRWLFKNNLFSIQVIWYKILLLSLPLIKLHFQFQFSSISCWGGVPGTGGWEEKCFLCPRYQSNPLIWHLKQNSLQLQIWPTWRSRIRLKVKMTWFQVQRLECNRFFKLFCFIRWNKNFMVRAHLCVSWFG